MQSIERCSLDLIGHIVVQLNDLRGTPRRIGDEDVPVVFRDFCHLGAVSKIMAKKVHSPKVTLIFLKSLSGKYKRPIEHFAAILNTAASKNLLEKYIKENGDDNSFATIQKIRSIFLDVLLEGQKLGLELEGYCPLDSSLNSNTFYIGKQTKEGFILGVNDPAAYLITPFGKVFLYSRTGYFSRASDFFIAERLIKRCNAVFKDFAENINNHISEIVTFEGPTMNKKEIVSDNELMGYIDSQHLIVNTWSSSIYQIKNINNLPLPEIVSYASPNNQRSQILIKNIFNIIKKRPHSYNFKIYQKHRYNFTDHFKHISEVADWAIDLITKLNNEPVSMYQEGSIKKLLPLSEREAKIIDMLNQAAINHLNNYQNWTIRWLNSIDGFRLVLTIEKNDRRCDLNTLKKAYENVLQDVTKSWIKFAHDNRSSDNTLLVKKQRAFPEEDSFIFSLLPFLGVTPNHLLVYSLFKGYSLGLDIAKEHAEETVQILGLKLEQNEVDGKSL